MREIVFRGKRVDNGEWVYGNLITDDDDVYILPQKNLSKGIDIGGWIDGVQSYEVNPETVGQYTGLKDLHGTRIFEADIVKDITPLYKGLTGYCCTMVKCDKCGEYYEPICICEHICKMQNSYPVKEKPE